jgi:predicted component of type VI protein secretion system
LAGVAEGLDDIERLLARQGPAMRPYVQRAARGDFSDFQAYAARQRRRFQGSPILYWWANPVFDSALKSHGDRDL